MKLARSGASRQRNIGTGVRQEIESALEVQAAAGRPSPVQRPARLRALREAVTTQKAVIESPSGTALRRRLWQLALDCDDWPIAAAVGTAMQAFTELDADDTVSLSIALWRQGSVGKAVDVMQSAFLVHLDLPRAETLYASLRAWSSLHDADLPADGDLHLEPLGHQHVEDFRWQYDPMVVELCCLPDFQCDEHWNAWLDDCLAQGDQLLFGIWHRIWGFIGCVSLVVVDGIGFFYYWLGAEYRGHGYAPRAGAALLEWAERSCGLHTCYAKVYSENRSSQIGLEKIGFTALDIAIGREDAPPERLFRCPAPLADVTEEARDFLVAIGAQTRVLSPWCPRRQAERADAVEPWRPIGTNRYPPRGPAHVPAQPAYRLHAACPVTGER